MDRALRSACSEQLARVVEGKSVNADTDVARNDARAGIVYRDNANVVAAPGDPSSKGAYDGAGVVERCPRIGTNAERGPFHRRGCLDIVGVADVAYAAIASDAVLIDGRARAGDRRVVDRRRRVARSQRTIARHR